MGEPAFFIGTMGTASFSAGLGALPEIIGFTTLTSGVGFFGIGSGGMVVVWEGFLGAVTGIGV